MSSTGGERGASNGGRGAPSPEERERAAAWRRAEARERARAEGAPGHEPARDAASGRARPGVAARAFAALAENVRDYAIFLVDPDGIITFWGEGARPIKWWTRDHAEGAHMRLLYPPGGSDDGTAEEHLREAAERGEYAGEGQRLRSDGSTFWAGGTTTAPCSASPRSRATSRRAAPPTRCCRPRRWRPRRRGPTPWPRAPRRAGSWRR